MAAAVATVANVKADVTARRRTVRKITGDSSTYLAGGYPLTAAQFGLHSILHTMPCKIVSGFSAAFAHADPIIQTNGSIKLRIRAAAGTEVPDGTDMSTLVMIVEVEGTG